MPQRNWQDESIPYGGDAARECFKAHGRPPRVTLTFGELAHLLTVAYEDGANRKNAKLEPVNPSPHREWITNNWGELRKYAGEYVALDPAVGIVAHGPDQKTFGEQLRGLSPEQDKRVIIFHTAMYGIAKDEPK